jgi:hypothetical protein
MKIVNKGVLRILYPENGYELINKTTGANSDKIYLGALDSMDNYIEVMKEDYYNNINDLKNELDDENILLMNTLDSLIVLLEPVITAMPMTLNEEEKVSPIDIIVKFYVRMIERGLKDIDEVPSSFKSLIENKDF